MWSAIWLCLLQPVLGYYNYHYQRRWDEPPHWYRRIRHMDRISRHIVFPTEYLHPDGMLRNIPPHHPYYYGPGYTY